MDPVALKKAFELYPDTKAVIVANLYGTPAKLDEIRKICDETVRFLLRMLRSRLVLHTRKDRPAHSEITMQYHSMVIRLSRPRVEGCY